jgi:tripeptide aminopeptidase
MSLVDTGRLVQTFLDLVQIDSPTYEERTVMARLGAEFEALGLPVVNDRTGRDGAGNLHVRLPGSRPDLAPVMLCAHTDTVEPGRGVKPVVRDGVVRSDGRTILGAHNKASVALLLEAVRVLRQHNRPHRDVDLVFTWGEERGHAGAVAFDVSRLSARIGITLDDVAPPGHVTVSAPAYYSIHARFVGRAAHAGAAPEKGINAIAALASAVARMRLGRIDDETTANVGLVRGGTARNSVPGVAEFEGEARSRDNAKLEALVASLRAALEDGARATGATLEATIKQEYAAYRLDASAPIVQEVMAAVTRAGLACALGVSGGGSDSNTFNEKGVPCVNVAIGMSEIHTVNEYIRIDDLRRSCDIALALMTGA